MKKLMIGVTMLALVAFFVGITTHDASAQKQKCTTIQDGILVYTSSHFLAGQPIKTGFDIFGYNYQAHLFIGYYANAYLGRDGFPPYEGDTAAYLEKYPDAASKWYWPYRDTTVSMKWNDEWLSNQDCNKDGLLDRPDDFGGTYIGSGAWETNHQSGTYTDASGNECHWTYFVKIIAAPKNGHIVRSFYDWNYDGVQEEVDFWAAPNGTLIGPTIWGDFAIVQEINNDSCAGFHGLYFKSPASPGLGKKW
ncbi:MAG: hypothetical protein Q8O91_07965 [Candidatus Aminicenantes bacterium]|nr:hypothetical protein [Candidatus Aminicenantes bacterium]